MMWRPDIGGPGMGAGTPAPCRRAVLAGLATLPGVAAAAAAPVFDARRYGAAGDGRRNDTAAVQSAVDACARIGGGTVLLPPGTYLCGAIELRSHVTLHIGAGAVLRASPRRADFGMLGALVFAKGATGIGIAGEGEIDGNFPAFLTVKPGGGFERVPTFLGLYDPQAPAPGATSPNGRPRPILLVDCRRVHIRDVAVRRSASWTIHLLGCEDVAIDRIIIDNDMLVPNCDGIDIDHCRRVRVTGCTIRAGDDAIVLKASNAFKGRGPCAEIIVTGCTLTSGSAGFKIGSEGSEPVRDVIVSACVITDSNRGLGIQNRDGSLVENIAFSDCVIRTRRYPREWWGAGEPIHVSSISRRAGQASAGIVRGVSFADIRCQGPSGAYLYGEADDSLRDMAFRGVAIDVHPPADGYAGQYDLRPGWRNRAPFPGRVAAFHAEGVDGLVLSDVRTRFTGQPFADHGSALFVRRVTGLDASGFGGRAATPGLPDRDLGV